jgi:hypothetical protein
MIIDKPGIFFDFPEADYFADPCPSPSLSQSLAKVLLDQTELHAMNEHPRLAPPDDDEAEEKYVKAQAIGNAAHAIMIGRGKTMAVSDLDTWTGDRKREFRDAAEAEGKTPILRKHFEVAVRMVAAARAQLDAITEPAAADAFVKGHGEVVIAAEVDGVWLRSLVDWMVNPRVLVDFKTTAMSVAPHVVPKLMGDAGWPIQAAMQERILDLVDPEGAGRRKFYFIAQENYRPFALTMHELPEATMTMGRKMIARAELLWRDAMLTNHFPGYAPVIHRPEYPAWQESQWLNREIADAAHERVPVAKFNPSVLRAG